MYARNLPSLHEEPRYPDDPSLLPEGSVIEGEYQTHALHDVADYVVVGSGAAGASAALVLAQRGFSVALIEEGSWVRTREFTPDLFDSMKRMIRDMGTSTTFGRSNILVLQGRCVGGSTTINSAIAWRPTAKVIDDWTENYGIAGSITARNLEPHFDEIERGLNVHAADEQTLGHHNHMFAEAATRLGFDPQRTKRYETGCEGSGLCLTGCMRGRKKAMSVSYVPETLHLGGRIYTSARVEHVEHSGGRAIAVRARFNAPGRPTLRVRARRGVIVAASAVQTPNILRRSGLRSRALGENFQGHPGVGLCAQFDRPVHMDLGATQGYNSMHFSEGDKFKLESFSLPPELIAVRIPGYGSDVVRPLAGYENLVCWVIVLRSEATGRVANILGGDQVMYSLTKLDMTRVRKGLRTVAEMMFAAGAREVWPGVHGMPTTLRSPDQLKAWDTASIDQRAYGLMMSHMFGTARMGPDPRTSVVGNDFQSHEIEGLYVLDSSVFPTNLGVNPQHTIMAVAKLGAERIANSPLTSIG